MVALDSSMGLHDTVQLRTDLPVSFENDGFELSPEMAGKYLESIVDVREGQMRNRDARFCKNASIFDVTGKKIVWGDIAPADVKRMKGVYYILSEHKSFWDPKESAVKGWNFRGEDPNSKSQFRDSLPDFEPNVFDINYVKRNALARIVDGEIQTSEGLIGAHFQ